MSGKVYVVVPNTGQSLIITDADNVVVLLTGHLIFRDGNIPVSGYAPGRWVEFVEVTNPEMKATLRARADGGAGSA